jgi:hypothetical protein
MYHILPYTYRKAKKIGVKVLSSKRANKKIDIYKNGRYITSVGQKGYYDYPTYLYYFGKEVADKRKKLYKLRHSKDRLIKNSRGWFADQLLW